MRPVGHCTIGVLSGLSGVGVETIRYYEREGLMPPPARSASGYRMYGPDDRSRLVFVRRARELGFTLDQVRRLLDLADERAGSCQQAQGVAAAQLREIRRKLADLRRMERALNGAVAACSGGTMPRCPLIEALAAA
ncbi:MAG: helix-turn-helix domain-containing protein [Alphaproteobacteria bacterium]|nr:helix-turn-helix domain-containing protein [Alphaproteobacteria bacterium]